MHCLQNDCVEMNGMICNVHAGVKLATPDINLGIEWEKY